MTALAVPLLKERTDARNWVAISVGLVGVLIMLRPSVVGTGDPRAPSRR